MLGIPIIEKTYLHRCRQAKCRTSTKLTTMVEFPLTELDMTPHLAARGGGAGGSPSHSRAPRRRVRPLTPPDNLYDLFAVCYHHGDDLETGHYTAACKNPYDSHWYKFDDSRVTLIEDEKAQSELVNNTAYMLFYKRKKPLVTHGSPEAHAGHWALRMPKYVRRSEPIAELAHVKEETLRDPELAEDSPSGSEDGQTEGMTSPETGDVIEARAEVEEPGEGDAAAEPLIHKDVHVNPKMTPVDVRRPRSVDYPARLVPSKKE